MSGTNVTENHDYRGVVPMDPRHKYANLQRADSSFNEANPRPGVPVAARNTGMVLETSGRMDNVASVLPQIVLTTRKAGMPGAQSGRFVWSPNYGIPAAHETTVGWDAPDAISRQELIGFDGGNNWTTSACLRTQKNVVLLGLFKGSSPIVLRKTFDTATYASAGTAKWSWAALPGILLDGTSSATGMARSAQAGTLCYLQLPDGRIHAYYLVKDSTISGKEFGQVIMHWSDDDGATWTSTGKYILNRQIPMSGVSGVGAIGFDVNRMRVAYCNGQCLLFIQGLAHRTDGAYTYVDATWQYASSDLGETFDAIDISDGTTADAKALVAKAGGADVPAFLDLCTLTDGSGFAVSFASVDPAANLIGACRVKVFGDAYTPWANATAVKVQSTDLSNGILTSGQHLTGTNTTIAVDENGVLTVGWERNRAGVLLTGGSFASISYDNAVTWRPFLATMNLASPTDDRPWWFSGDTGMYPDNYCSTYQCGRWMIFAVFYADNTGDQTPALQSHKIWELDLGGYTTSTRPFRPTDDPKASALSEADDTQVVWDKTWIATNQLRGTNGWAETGTGGTEVVNNNGYTVLTTAANTIITTNATIDRAASTRTLVLAEWLVSVGTSQIELLIDNGTNKWNLRLQQSTTQILLMDIVAAATLATVAAPSPGGFNQVLFSFDTVSQQVAVWVRGSANDVEIRPWVSVGLYAVTPAATVAAAGTLRVFQGNNSTSQWKAIYFASGAYGRPMFRSGTYLDTIYGRTWSPFPLSVYSGDGVRVRAVDGPSWEGDSWTVTQRHEYGIENIFADIAPSPSRVWRSTSVAQQDIVVKLDVSADEGPPLGRVLVLYLLNVNFREADFYYRVNTGAGWTALGSLLLNAGQTGLSWTRDGHIIRADPATASANDYFPFNLLEGSRFLVTTGGGPAVLPKLITAATEGAWAPGTTIKPRIYVASLAGTEDASGGTGEIWSKDGVLIIHDAPDMCEIKLTIPAQPTAEGYFQVGAWGLGHLAYFGRQYARGRKRDWHHNVALDTSRSGRRRSTVLGPSRRSVTFGWANDSEIDETQLGVVPPSPDYILAATGSTDPVATPADTALKMAGLIESIMVRGPASPVLYLDKVPIVGAESTDTTIVRRDRFLYGRLMGDPHIDNVLGDEGSSTAGELTRYTGHTLEEEL